MTAPTPTKFYLIAITAILVLMLAAFMVADRQGHVAKAETANTAAYDAFLKGMEHLHRWTVQDTNTAISYFDKAIKFDGDFARAHAARAAAYFTLFEEGWYVSLNLSGSAVQNRVLASLTAAMRNPTPLAHQVAARLRLSLELYEQANEEAERALSLDPNDADSYVTLAKVLILRGRPEDAVDLLRQAMRLDPKSSVTHHQFILGLAKFGLEQYEEAAELFAAVVEAIPERLAGRVYLISVYGHLNRHSEARTELSRLDEALRVLNPTIYGYSLFTAELTYKFENYADKVRLLEGLQNAGVPDSFSFQPPSSYSTRKEK